MENLFVKYYGEYSLIYWIKLLLKEDIVLPDFQRQFKWSKKDIKKLVESIAGNQYVPPVVIGNFIDSKGSYNYILDGQQRLCSILLVYLTLFPKSQKFTNEFKNYDIEINSKDNSNEISDSGTSLENSVEELSDDNNIYSATRLLEYIQEKFNYKKTFNENLDEFKKSILSDTNFDKLDKDILDIIVDKNNNDCDKKNSIKEFYNVKNLPFIYIKPIKNKMDEKELSSEKLYYSNLFYNINKLGQSLTNQESRDSIIWLFDDKIKKFFNDNYYKTKVGGKLKDPIDFQFYLSVLVFIENKIKGDTAKISDAIKCLFGTRYKKDEREEFIISFLKSIIETNNGAKNEQFGNFNDIFGKLSKNNAKLLKCVNEQVKSKEYDTILSFELEFIGVMYWTLFQGKDINLEKYTSLINQKTIDIEGNTKEAKDKYRRSVNDPNNFRKRVEESIKIFMN